MAPAAMGAATFGNGQRLPAGEKAAMEFFVLRLRPGGLRIAGDENS